jgi:hypothetical protein
MWWPDVNQNPLQSPRPSHNTLRHSDNTRRENVPTFKFALIHGLQPCLQPKRDISDLTGNVIIIGTA